MNSNETRIIVHPQQSHLWRPWLDGTKRNVNVSKYKQVFFLQQYCKLVESTVNRGKEAAGWVMPLRELATDILVLLQLLPVCVQVYNCLLRSVPECATSWPFLSQNTATITHIPWMVNERTNYRSASDTSLHNYQSKATRLSVALQRRPNQSIT